MHLFFPEHIRAQIPFPGIWEDNHNGFPRVFRPFRHLGGRPHRRAGRNPDQQALGSRELAPGHKRVFIRYGKDFVIDPGIQDLRDKPRADPLDLVRPCLALGKHGGICRFHRHNVEMRVFLL